MDKKISDNIIRVEFAEVVYPEFVAQKNKDWVLYGEKNDYTKYLIDLFNRHSEHNAIITAKTSYVGGKGLTYDKTKVEDPAQQAKLDSFIARANDFYGWNEMLPMLAMDFELFNGFALQVVYGRGGKITDIYHIEFSKIRIRKDNKTAYYCGNWFQGKPESDKSFKSYPLYTDEIKSGSAIFYFKVRRPTSVEYGDTYPIPDYVGATSAIETDINIDVFHLSNTQNGMTAQGLLTFFNGNPTPEDKRKIKQMFENNYTGPNKAGKTILSFVNENQKGAEFTNLGASDLDKQFEQLSKRLIQKICAGHKIDPVLIGIDTATSWTRTNLIEKYERFKNTYVEPRQKHVLDVIKFFAGKQGVLSEELEIIPFEPIEFELPISEAEVANTLTFDEKRQLIAKKYNLELTAEDSDKDKRLTLANKLGVGGVSSLLEVIKDTSISAERKVMILNGLFGVSIKKAQAMIGFTPATIQPTVQPTQMNADKDLILEALLACGQPINDDEVLEVRCVDFDSDEAAMKFEKEQVMKFAVEGEVKTVRNAVLDLLAGDPSIKSEKIAQVLGLDVEYVDEQINYLIDKGIINETVGGFFPTGKGLDRVEDIEPIETEIYTVYRYETRDDVPKAISGSRPFCQKLMAAKKEYTRSEIDKLSNSFGTNVWIYRGGFYNNPNTGETEPWCRHIFKAYTKSRRKKK